MFQANGNYRKAGIAIHISKKIDFNTKDVKKDKKEHYIMMKEPIQEDHTLINIHAYRCTLNI